MGRKEGTAPSPIYPVGPTTTKKVAPDGSWWSFVNFKQSDDGGLVSITVPLPLLADSSGDPPGNGANPTPTAGAIQYATTHGVFHGRVRSGHRDVLLIHTGDEIWEFRGWSQDFNQLIAPSGGNHVTANLGTPTTDDFPTQFVATPTGIVILPQTDIAYFYDGITCLPLGYSDTPAPPIGLGPESTSSQWMDGSSSTQGGINDSGYVVDGLYNFRAGGTTSLHLPTMRFGRLGTIETPGQIERLANPANKNEESHMIGYLRPGRYRCKVQDLDIWGNLSPLSAPSNDVQWAKQPSMDLDHPTAPSAAPDNLEWVNPDQVKKQVGWAGVEPGPSGTIARVLYRTQDLENSGTAEYYEVPRDSWQNPGAFATMPDNLSTFYPDNIPDGWLGNTPTEVMPMPRAKLGEMAFGRMFFANVEGDEGALYFSMVGRWGTIEVGSKIYPDPSAAAITGLHRIDAGLLVFTARGTFLIEPNDAGDGFRVRTISSTVGCVAPSSIATMRNGATVWLGVDGFYGYGAGQVTFLFEQHRYHAKRFNRARKHRACAGFDRLSGEYRCWVAYEGSATNNRCFTYDGSVWRERTDVAASGVTVTDDHRQLMIVTGVEDQSALDGAWVLDTAAIADITSTAKTSWFKSMDSRERSSHRRVHVWLRELSRGNTVGGSGDDIQIKGRVNYRNEVVSIDSVATYRRNSAKYDPSPPAIWGETLLGATGAEFRDMAPYWATATLDLPSCEVYQIEITCTKRFELMGISIEDMPRDSRGAQGIR